MNEWLIIVILTRLISELMIYGGWVRFFFTATAAATTTSTTVIIQNT